MDRKNLIAERQRERFWYPLLFLTSFVGSLLVAIFTGVKQYTTLEDCSQFSGTVTSHSRSSEAIVKLDNGKKIYARSNQQTMNHRLAGTKKDDRLTGYYIESTQNVVQLFINGEKVAGFEDYQLYERWERQFLAGCSLVLFVCALVFATSYWRLPKKGDKGTKT